MPLFKAQRARAHTSAAMVAMLVVVAGCSTYGKHQPSKASPGTVRGGVTYTVEPFDFDGVAGLSMSVTQRQLGGSMCPCVKVHYRADGLHNDEGVTAIAEAPLHAGDTVLGFSLGSQVISLYLAKRTPPPGVQFVLLGDTFARNDELAARHQGIPPDIANAVTLVVREYDGWSDKPTRKTSPHFEVAMHNAELGAATLHDYVDARIDDAANVTTTRGNITAVLIPTQHLPINRALRMLGNSKKADDLDAQQRPLIDSAYDRLIPTPQQLAGSTGQQVRG
jgi:hypothetical protein